MDDDGVRGGSRLSCSAVAFRLLDDGAMPRMLARIRTRAVGSISSSLWRTAAVRLALEGRQLRVASGVFLTVGQIGGIRTGYEEHAAECPDCRSLNSGVTDVESVGPVRYLSGD